MHASEVKKLLHAYLDTEREVDYQIERLNVLNEKIYSLGSPEMSDMPKSPNPVGDKIADMVVRKIEAEEWVNKLLELQKQRRRLYEDITKQIREPDKRAVILLRYLDGVKWERVLESLFAENEDFEERRDSYMRRVMRLHGWALQDMARIIDGNAGFQMRIKQNESPRQ